MTLSQAERTRRWKERHPERARASAARTRAKRRENGAYRDHLLRKRYNITLEEFDLQLAEQDGRCAICGVTEPGGRGTWHVDHNHRTGARRGLLCTACNIGLGMFGDDIELLEKAIKYIRRYEGVTLKQFMKGR